MFLLFLSLVSFLHHFTNATNPLYETVFVVGPEPQPVVFDTKDSPLGNLFGGDDSANIIDVALPSIPLENMEGRRKLKVPAQLVRPNVRSGSQSVGRDQHWKPDDTERYHDGVNNADEKHSDGLPRSLQGVCSIATTIFGFKYDDNGVENNGFFSIPPDPHGAVGATRLVAVVNAMMEVRQKDGTLMFRDGFQSFFSGFSEAFATGARFFDPKVIYDEHQRRFVIVVLQRSDSPQLSRIWLSVSKDENPDSVADWNQFFINSIFVIDGNNAWADYPGLEVDEEAVYVTNNMFRFSDRANVGVRLWTFSKGVTNGFYAGQVFSPLVINPYATQGIALTSMPAQVHGSSGVDGSVGTFLAGTAFFTDGSVRLQIYTLFDPLGTSPTFTIQTINLGVLTQGFITPVAPQPGTSVGIHTFDGRIMDAVWRSNKLWVVFTINPTSGVNQGQATAHWVRCNTSGGTVTFEAQGNLGGEGIAAGASTYFPSVAVNSLGVVAYGYAASSPTTFAGAYVSIGTSEQAYTVKSGVDSYIRDFGDPRNRWGDYSGISVDPTDDSFWVFNEYADTRGSADSYGDDGRWGTAWGRLACSTAPMPAPVPIPAPVLPPMVPPVRALVPIPAPVLPPMVPPVPAPVPIPAPVLPPMVPPVRAPVPIPAPVLPPMVPPVPAPVPIPAPILPPIVPPVPAPAPILAPVLPPIVPPVRAPVPIPAPIPPPMIPPVPAPAPFSPPCRLLCRLFCGFFGRLLGLCRF